MCTVPEKESPLHRSMHALESMVRSSPESVQQYRQLHIAMRELVRTLQFLDPVGSDRQLHTSFLEPTFDPAACPLAMILRADEPSDSDDATREAALQEAVALNLCRIETLQELGMMVHRISLWLSARDAPELLRGAVWLLYDACRVLRLDGLTDAEHDVLFGDRQLRRHWRSIAASCEEICERGASTDAATPDVTACILRIISSHCR